jgi:ABC-type cobalamin/Fe3+-siderophores transport system ATPase subunit
LHLLVVCLDLTKQTMAPDPMRSNPLPFSLRRTMAPAIAISFCSYLLLDVQTSHAFSYCNHRHPFLHSRQQFSTLFAKKKPSVAALEALEALEKTILVDDSEIDRPLSKKEMLKLQKQQLSKAAPVAANKKEQLLEAALAADSPAADDSEGASSLSKKELRALKKQKGGTSKSDEDAVEAATVNGKVNGEHEAKAASAVEDDPEEVVDPSQPTLEDKIRKERPPPRIRVMESSQPGYTSLRLENVGIIFRNQEVLKDVTWGVSTGDRIGLVGPNGAGKSTQLRILAGELEPTTGDVVKSSKDLRVAVLRQEFVEDLVLDRTLKEEMLSVFEEENQILQAIKDAEAALASTPADEPEQMQQLLDRMQELQNKAQDKDVYALESRVKKVMDVMGFTDDEEDDLVASFSGGWKMRIGLGKVLLKDPNVLLLDEPTNHLDLERSVSKVEGARVQLRHCAARGSISTYTHRLVPPSVLACAQFQC